MGKIGNSLSFTSLLFTIDYKVRIWRLYIEISMKLNDNLE